MKESSFVGRFEKLCLLTSAGAAMMLAQVHPCLAQETPAPAVEGQRADPLEAFEVADRAVADAFAALKKEVEAEMRVEASARELQGEASRLNFLDHFVERDDFEGLAHFSQGVDAGDLAKFPKVKNAKAEFRAALVRRKQFYKEQYPKALETFVAETAKACREGKSAQQISATLERVPEYEALEKKLSGDVPGRRQFDEELRYLSKFNAFVAAEAADDMRTLGSVARELESGRLSAEVSLPLKEMEDYRIRTVKRIREQGVSELAEIVKAVSAVESEEQLLPLLTKVEALAGTEQALTGRVIGVWNDRYERALSFLKEWRIVLSLESEKRWQESAEYARRLRSNMSGVEPQLVVLAEKRSELDAAKARKMQQTRATAFADKLPQRITGITSPEALQDFADELTPMIAEGGDGADSFVEWLRSFQRELRQIASAWRVVGTDPNFALQFMRDTGVTHPWAKESARLREKVVRKAAVVQTGQTELQEPPLDQLPLAEAFRKLMSTAASSSDWERVHELLQAQSAILPQPSTSEDLITVKAYLTGLNFERAELFSDAVQAYRTVLRSTSQNVPIKEAAEHLKDIQSKHPELFKPRPR